MIKKATFVAALIGTLTLAGCGNDEPAAPAAAPAHVATSATAHAEALAAAPVVNGKVSQLAPDVLTAAQWTRTDCSLDTTDGNYSKEISLDRSKPHVFRGWVLDETKQPAGKFSLVLKGTQNYAIEASTGELRKDVGDYFKDSALSTAGFNMSADLKLVPTGAYDITFIVQKSGRTYSCDSGKKISLD